MSNRNIWKMILMFILLKCSSVFGQFYETNFEISPNGFEISSCNPLIDQLNMLTVKNLIQCSMKCSEQIQCSFFDFDSTTNYCRSFIFGLITPSLSSSSRVGSVQYSIDQYSKYNETCETNSNQINRYLICGTNQRYQCPQGFQWNGTMCKDIYWETGPQLNLRSSILHGWSLCYNGTYNIQLNGQPLNDILNQCNRSKLLLGCGLLTNPNIYSVAAMDCRQNVLYNCSYNTNCSQKSNGNQWYFSGNFSWGFADQSDTVTRTWCDGNESQNPDSCLCWHTISGYDGYRCGSTIFNLTLNPSLWQRVIWHTD